MYCIYNVKVLNDKVKYILIKLGNISIYLNLK